MDQDEIYIRSLLKQYEVFRLELIIFTIFFMIAILMVPVAWVTNHVWHNYTLGWMAGVVAAVLGLSMATHCGNTISSLKRIATALNKEMGDHRTFEYDLGHETEIARYVITLIGKIIGILLLLNCFFRWPQL